MGVAVSGGVEAIIVVAAVVVVVTIVAAAAVAVGDGVVVVVLFIIYYCTCDRANEEGVVMTGCVTTPTPTDTTTNTIPSSWCNNRRIGPGHQRTVMWVEDVVMESTRARAW